MGKDIKLFNRASLPPIGHYSHGCSVGNTIFISGQLPVTAEGIMLTDAPFVQQAQLVLANMDECLAACEALKHDLVMVRIYLKDINNWEIFNGIYSKWLEGWMPARAVIGVSELHYGAALEIEAVAARK